MFQDAKPSGVLDLHEYSIKELPDDTKKKVYPWEMACKDAEKKVILIAATEKEKGDWVGLIKKARELRLQAAGNTLRRQGAPPPPPSDSSKPDVSVVLVKKGCK